MMLIILVRQCTLMSITTDDKNYRQNDQSNSEIDKRGKGETFVVARRAREKREFKMELRETSLTAS